MLRRILRRLAAGLGKGRAPAHQNPPVVSADQELDRALNRVKLGGGGPMGGI